MGSTQIIWGSCADSTKRSLVGFHMDSVWILSGFYMDSMYGFYTDSIFYIDSSRIVPRFCMDVGWILHGFLFMDSTKIL